jgi:hypothetical protein
LLSGRKLGQVTANEHAEATAAHEVKLQAEVTATREIQRVKEAMARQAQKEAADLKEKLEDAEQKAKDAASNLQAVVEGKFSLLPWADSVCCCMVLVLILRPWFAAGAQETEEALKIELAAIKSQLTAIKEKSMETRRG